MKPSVSPLKWLRVALLTCCHLRAGGKNNHSILLVIFLGFVIA
jgi:hypothetical protein